MARLTRTLRPAAVLAAVLAAGAARVAGAEPLRVMAFGDSITAGAGSTHGAGYRLAFWNRMQAEGIEVDMVGGKADGPETLDNRHQGYSPGDLQGLSAAAYDKMRAYEPDVVLVLTGTDEWRDDRFSPPSFAVNLGILIDRIFTARPNAKVFVATLPPPKFGRGDDTKRALNRLLRRAVREREERRQAVYLVDAYEAIDPAREMLDANRPNDAGYEKIGDAFADAVLGTLGEDPVE
jgi:lysophospholipase L1-like esterase